MKLKIIEIRTEINKIKNNKLRNRWHQKRFFRKTNKMINFHQSQLRVKERKHKLLILLVILLLILAEIK